MKLGALKDEKGTHQLVECPKCNFLVDVENMIFEGSGDKKESKECVFCQQSNQLKKR